MIISIPQKFSQESRTAKKVMNEFNTPNMLLLLAIESSQWLWK